MSTDRVGGAVMSATPGKTGREQRRVGAESSSLRSRWAVVINTFRGDGGRGLTAPERRARKATYLSPQLL